MTIEAPWKTQETWTESLTQEQDPAVSSGPESLLVTGAAVAAGVLTNRILKSAWRQWTDEEPPINPAAAEIAWRDALVWAASVGAAIGVSRVCARRGTAAIIRKWR